VVSNPEFLKEGSAVADCMSPERVIIGTSEEKPAETLKALYAPFTRNYDRFIITDAASAEMIKYASNAMLATRISFMNELSHLCEAAGADINKVRHGMGADSRIGTSFLYAGIGYGGSCFPKDVQALIHTAKENGCTADILESVEAVNKRQKLVLADKVVRRFGDDLSGRRFAMWGLAFKPNTDDLREAPSIVIAGELVKRGAAVAAYDMCVKEFPVDVTIVKSKYDALNDADALLLVTEWKEFRTPDFDEIKLRLKSPVIFDGRNQYSSKLLREAGFEYYQIGAK
jgi:UDPglucose 6-dehydrogenase